MQASRETVNAVQSGTDFLRSQKIVTGVWEFVHDGEQLLARSAARSAV
jgi:hypothetical protein